MKNKSKYRLFDPIDCLVDEECFDIYITALREDGADEEEIQGAYLDIERARIVHGIPKREPELAAV